MNIAYYESQFLDFQQELTSYLFRLLTNRQDAEDLVQDTFIRAFDNLSSFKQKASFKTWVFTIASNLAKNLLQKRSRWLEETQDYGAALHSQSPNHLQAFLQVFQRSPAQEYEIKEHITYCFNCINKTLLIEQQMVLLLKEVYAFKITEIMSILHLTEGKVKHALADARKHMLRIFNKRCALINKQGTCHQCTELKGILNPEQEAHIQANSIKMVRKGEHPNKAYLLELRMDLVRAIDPLESPNNLLTTYMLENAEHWVREGQAKKILEFSSENDD